MFIHVGTDSSLADGLIRSNRDLGFHSALSLRHIREPERDDFEDVYWVHNTTAAEYMMEVAAWSASTGGRCVRRRRWWCWKRLSFFGLTGIPLGVSPTLQDSR